MVNFCEWSCILFI